MLSYDIKFITCDNSLHIKNCDFKSYRYANKKRSEESVYDTAKRSYCESRGGRWRAPHQIKQLENYLREKSIVKCEWTNRSLITIILSSGAIAYVTVKPYTTDVTQILFDRYFVGKLPSQVAGVIISSSHLVFTHAERLATLVTFRKSCEDLPCRITDRDPHLQTIELSGASRRAERRLSWREQSGGVNLLTWCTSSAEPAPWSPVLEDHANLHLYFIHGQQMVLKAYHQLEKETLSAEMSQKTDNLVHIIEQIACHKNGVSLDWYRYTIPDTEVAIKLSSVREEATKASIPAPARLVKLSVCDTKLLVACIDGSIHVIHSVVGITNSVKAGFIATDVRWAGDLIVASEDGGRVQCFDRALSLLHHHAKCLDFTTYLKEPRRMQLLASRSAAGGPIILAHFTGGPLTLLRIMHPKILTAWMRSGRTDNAVSLLITMDWDIEGNECLWAMNQIVCSALRKGASHIGAKEALAQAALGAYLAPPAPHTAQAARYAPRAHDLARKLFHHLLRRGRIEKAMSLAVDLSAWDLFADARWASERLGLTDLAQEAISLTEYYYTADSECSTSCSCTSHSCSDSDDDTSATETKNKPPPLPRVQTHPAPITTQDKPTNSIRPNLHNHLDKDKTIWNKVKDDTHRVESNHVLNLDTKWPSVDNMLRKGPSKYFNIINENTNRTVIDIIPRQNERQYYRHLYQTELLDNGNNLVYKYQNYHSNSNLNGEWREHERVNKDEKNKVKFSDTVTIAVVSPPATDVSRELADSLPLCPPHRYLAAFTPAPAPLPRDSTGDDVPQKPKIKVVHFGMV